jgi:hypothetical protein
MRRRRRARVYPSLVRVKDDRRVQNLEKTDLARAMSDWQSSPVHTIDHGGGPIVHHYY